MGSSSSLSANKKDLSLKIISNKDWKPFHHFTDTDIVILQSLATSMVKSWYFSMLEPKSSLFSLILFGK